MTAGHIGVTLAVTYLGMNNPELAVLSCFIQGIPDLQRHFERMIESETYYSATSREGESSVRFKETYGGWMNSYQLFHKPWEVLSGWRLFLFILLFWVIIFPIGLHVGYDYFCHYKNTSYNRVKGRVGEWNVFAKVSEVVWSTVGIALLVDMFGVCNWLKLIGW